MFYLCNLPYFSKVLRGARIIATPLVFTWPPQFIRIKSLKRNVGLAWDGSLRHPVLAVLAVISVRCRFLFFLFLVFFSVIMK